ncbi:MAG TPA: polymer-forming cytoskeletal protein [Pyrinomonadaceae bacterium]
MSDDSAKQIVEAGTEFEGVLRSQSPVVVSGQLTGEVNAPSLTLTNDGSVFGKVRVNQLRSCGTLGGEIDAENVELSGSVSDNTVIRSKTLAVKLEESDSNTFAVSFGNCELYVGNPSSTKSRLPIEENLPVAVN